MALPGRARGAEGLLAGWATVIAVLLVSPDPGFRDIGPGVSDKLVHAVLFLVLAFLAVPVARPRVRRPLALAAAASFLYGALLEAAQGVLGYRDPALGDLVANGVGSVAGAALTVVWPRP